MDTATLRRSVRNGRVVGRKGPLADAINSLVGRVETVEQAVAGGVSPAPTAAAAPAADAETTERLAGAIMALAARIESVEAAAQPREITIKRPDEIAKVKGN